MESACLWQVGVSLAVRGELDEAERMLEDAVDLARKLGDARGVGAWQKSLAGLALMRGDHARAWRCSTRPGNPPKPERRIGRVDSLSNLAFLALEAGDAETARAQLSEALAIERESGHHVWLANPLEISARLAATEGQPALAIRLYARAALLREVAGAWLHYELGWPDPTPDIDDLRARVGEERFEEEWARGRAMTIIEAIDQASGSSAS